MGFQAQQTETAARLQASKHDRWLNRTTQIKALRQAREERDAQYMRDAAAYYHARYRELLADIRKGVWTNDTAASMLDRAGETAWRETADKFGYQETESALMTEEQSCDARS